MNSEQLKLVNSKLYTMASPLMQQRMKLEKMVLTQEDILYEQDETYQYWKSNCTLRGIHGRQDNMFENVMSKLLDFGLTKDDPAVRQTATAVLESDIWSLEPTFGNDIQAIVAVPFLVRAGYNDEKKVTDFVEQRVNTIINTIRTYGYQFESKKKHPSRFSSSFVFAFDPSNEALPTIYDLYLLAFVDGYEEEKVEIALYILNQEYRQIPDKAYVFDPVSKRYYAAGSVYHAADIETRRLLYIYLLSRILHKSDHPYFSKLINDLEQYSLGDGWFEFPKEYIKEKKDSYQMYSGSHMGMGVSRKQENWLKLESTFWMNLIYQNLVHKKK